MTEEVKQEEVTPEDQVKDLMGKIKSAITVYTHKHGGKAPESVEEIAAMLEQEEPMEKEEEVDEHDPKVLSFLIHYGKDPSKVAFYEDTKNGLFFSPSHGNWSDSSPEMVEHLNQREVESEDLFDMILHGVMDDSDYSKLNELGMMDKKCCLLHEKIKSMQSHAAELEKSLEIDEDEEELSSEEVPVEGEQVLSEEVSELSGEEVLSEPGYDVASEVIFLAQAPANNKEMESFVRNMIEKVLQERGL